MSVGLSSASCARTFCSVRMLSICDAYPTTDCSWSRDMSGVPMFTAMTMSAPIARTMSTGRLLTSPPSPRMRPSISTGANMPGTDMLARIAWYRRPDSKTTCLPGHHVGGDRAVRDRQLVEALDVVDVARELVQEQLEVAAGQRALEPQELAVAIPDLEGEREQRLLLLAPKADVAPLRAVGQAASASSPRPGAAASRRASCRSRTVRRRSRPSTWRRCSRSGCAFRAAP